MDEPEFAKQAKAHQIYRLADGTVVPSTTTITGIIRSRRLERWNNIMGLRGINTSLYVQEAGRIGTLTHRMIECDFTGEEVDISDFSETQIDKATNAMIKFLRYRDEHEMFPILLEEQMVSEEHKYGGTPDYVGYRDGIVAQIDFKTKPKLYREDFLQVAAYHNLLRENGYETERVYVLCLSRDDNTDEYYEQEVGLLEQRFEVFLHFLAGYRGLEDLPG